ncbi:MAG: hypothetical protein JW809_07885 [Pirellulales bacterium]|nr:hypothetical protein [Pirellulales bacterium]
MNTRLWIGIATIATLMMCPATVHAVLIWDAVTGDEAAITDGPGTWISSFGEYKWNTGVGPDWNVDWDNAAPDAARFGTAVSSEEFKVTVYGNVTATGVTTYKQYYLEPDFFNGGSITLTGTTPSVVTYYRARFYTDLATAPGVETLRLDGAGTSSRYLYLYGTNTFDAPVVIGGDGLLCMLHSDATAGLQGSIQGSASASVTVESGSTLSIRADNCITAKPFTISGAGLGGRGALEFYTSANSAGVRDLQGSVTLAGDATIRIQVNPANPDALTNIISGPISGDYALTVINSATGSAYPAPIHLTNPANSVKNLIAYSAGSGGSPVMIYLDANFAATESVSIGNKSTVYLAAGADLVAPSIRLEHATAALDASAAGMTIPSGQAVEGIGTIVGNVAVAGGGIEPGVDGPGVLIAGAGGVLDFSPGGNLIWGLAELKDSATGGPGSAYDMVVAPNDLVLGGTSRLTLDFAAVGDPAPGEAFWTSDHSWLIMDVGTSTTGNFGSIAHGAFAAGSFNTTVDGGGEVYLNFVAGTVVFPPGDASRDGKVDAADAALLAANWLKATGATWDDGDFNDDQAVDDLDLAILAANWGAGVPTAAVPEPGAVALLVLGLASLIGPRRRGRQR